MNQKTAKTLRKIARQVATQPLQYSQGTNKKPKLKMVDGKIEVEVLEFPGTITVNADSFRGVYRSMKKEYKQNVMARKHK